MSSTGRTLARIRVFRESSAARETGLATDRLLPTIDDWSVAARLAAATGAAAVAEGLARNPLGRRELERLALDAIGKSRARPSTWSVPVCSAPYCGMSCIEIRGFNPSRMRASKCSFHASTTWRAKPVVG
jgi:hypothetical protein